MSVVQPVRGPDVARRLSEAEATIEALISGQVDAVIAPATRTPVMLSRAQELLRQSEERYRRIVETTSEGIWTVDPELRITFVNRRLSEMLGYAVAEMVGRSLFDFVDDRAGEGAALLRTEHSRQGVGEESEVSLMRKDGTPVWALLKTSPIQGADGRIAGSLAMLTDRTRARQVDRDLRVERDHAQQYLDTAAVILLALDMAGRITLVNRHACAILGWTAVDLLGRDWFEACVPARIRDGLRKQFQRVFAGDASMIDGMILTKAGDERLVEWHNTLVRDHAGVVCGTLSSGSDVTDRHRVIEALQRTEERMRFALKNASIGTWDMDCATKAVRLSQIAEAQYGLAPGSFGETFDDFIACIHRDDREAAVSVMVGAMASGADFSMLNRTIPVEGKVRWLRGTGRFHLDAQGQPVRGVGISQDMTERQEMERQVQQAQKMEAVGRLASGVAHDFNNSLCVVLGWTEIALGDLPDEDPIRESLAEVVKAGQAAARLTKQLLSFSRQQVTDDTLFNPNALVAGLDTMLRRLIGASIELVTRTDAELGVVHMDRGQLDQVLMNLAVNARDAMPDGGVLTLATANEVVDAEYVRHHAGAKAGRYVTITVSDTGTGMSDEVQSRIFEPFFTTKPADKGTGLGLATSYGIVAQVGGRIDVESERGKGTTMKIYLPRADCSAPNAAAPETGAMPHGSERVLLVDDESPVRRVVERMLVSLGYAVVSAGSYDEALVIVARDAIDLLLTDIVLAGGNNGRRLAERALAIKPHMKVMFISGYTNDPSILRGLSNQNIALLQKPFTIETMSLKVRAVLDVRAGG